jgi:serine/threonine protein kinase
MGSVQSIHTPAGHEKSRMPGGFASISSPVDEALPQSAPQSPPQSPPQGAKRKRKEDTPDVDSTRLEKMPKPKPKRHHAGQTTPDLTKSTSEEHPLDPPIMSVRSREAPAGHELLKDYVRVKKLGESSEGRVYLMKSQTSKLLAVKMLKKHHYEDAVHLPIDSCLHLDLPMHRSIVLLSQIDVVDGHIWQGLSFENAGDLTAYFDRRRRYSLSELGHRTFVVHLLVQLGEAFAFLHHGLRRVSKGEWEVCPDWSDATRGGRGIIHGDTKPQNIMLNFSQANEYGILPDCRLGDFGHARLASSPLRYGGTPLYFCPEAKAADQGRRGPAMSRASDIYTFGLTLYRMITGANYRTGQNPRYLSLPAEYENLHFTRLLAACLQVGPRDRPTMDLDPDHGLIPAIDEAYGIRDRLMFQCTSSDRQFWAEWRKGCV